MCKEKKISRNKYTHKKKEKKKENKRTMNAIP